MQNAHDMGINAISWAPYSSYAELSVILINIIF